MPLTLEQYQEHFDHVLKIEERLEALSLQELFSPGSTEHNALVASIKDYLTHVDADIQQATLAAKCCKLLEVEALKAKGFDIDWRDRLDLTNLRLRQALRNRDTVLDLSHCNLWDYRKFELNKTVQAITQWGFTSLLMVSTILTTDQFKQFIRMPFLKKLDVRLPEKELWDLGKCLDDDKQPQLDHALCQALRQSNLESVVLEDIALFSPHAEYDLDNKFNLKFLCGLIHAPRLRELSLEGTNLCTLNTENWQILCNNLERSKLRSITLREYDLAGLPNSHWEMFCNAVKNSHLQAITLKRLPQKYYRTNDIETLTTSLETNYTITCLNVEDVPISPELSKLLNRNLLIAEIDKMLTNPYTPDMDFDFYLLKNKLKETIASYSEMTPNASLSRTKLEELQTTFLSNFQMKKATHFFGVGNFTTALCCWLEIEPYSKNFQEARLQAFQLKYTSERESISQSAAAFIAALPCCLNFENRLINFDEKEQQSLFDSILFAAAGGSDPNLISFSAVERVTLLRFVFFKNFIVRSSSSSTSVRFFALNAKTPLQNKIEQELVNIAVSDLKRHALPLQMLWEEVENDMRQAVGAELVNANRKREIVAEDDENLLNVLNAISQLSRSCQEHKTIKIK